MIPYPVRPVEPEPVTATPSSIRVARWCAAIQVAVASTAGVLAAARAGAVPVDPDGYGDLGRIILVGAAVLSFVSAVAVAVPAVLLRRHRPMARIALVAVEVVAVVPTGLGCVAARGQGFAEIALGVWTAAAVGVLTAVFRPCARAFTAEAY